VHLIPWIVALCCNPQSLLVNNPHHLHCFDHCFAHVASVQLHCFAQNSRVPCTHSIHCCSTTSCCHCCQCCCKLLGLPHPGTPFNGIHHAFIAPSALFCATNPDLLILSPCSHSIHRFVRPTVHHHAPSCHPLAVATGQEPRHSSLQPLCNRTPIAVAITVSIVSHHCLHEGRRTPREPTTGTLTTVHSSGIGIHAVCP